MTGEGEGKEGTTFFCFRSNFRAITRLETLATQARENVVNTTFQECKSPLPVDIRRSKQQGQCQPRFQVSIQLVPSEQGEVGVDL